MDEVVKALIETGGLGLLAGALFFFYYRAQITYRQDVRAERVLYEQHLDGLLHNYQQLSTQLAHLEQGIILLDKCIKCPLHNKEDSELMTLLKSAK